MRVVLVILAMFAGSALWSFLVVRCLQYGVTLDDARNEALFNHLVRKGDRE
jgi:hypothetical protein